MEREREMEISCEGVRLAVNGQSPVGRQEAIA